MVANPARSRTRLATRGTSPARAASALTPPEFDRLIHERLRLGIVSALAANPSLSFADLKRILQTTDGNLSVHARKLEDAEYISCVKSFAGRVPRSEYKLLPAGRRALGKYIDQMEEWIRLTRDGK